MTIVTDRMHVKKTVQTIVIFMQRKARINLVKIGSRTTFKCHIKKITDWLSSYSTAMQIPSTAY